MPARRFRLDPIKLILWTIGGGVILFALYGSYLTLSAGPLHPRSLAELRRRGHRARGRVRPHRARLHARLRHPVHDQLRPRRGLHVRAHSPPASRPPAWTTRACSTPTPSSAFALILAIAMLELMVIAVLLERIAYRPLRGAPRLVPLITAIGASLFLQYTARGFFGSGVRAYPQLRRSSRARCELGRMLMSGDAAHGHRRRPSR